MKPTFKDYLSIALALLAIFLCGYGIGFLFGERKGLRHAPPPPPAPTTSIAHWEENTLAVLQKTIELTPEQLAKVKAEIAASAATVRTARNGAFEAYRAELEELHQRLKPHLTPEQWEKLQKPPPDG